MAKKTARSGASKKTKKMYVLDTNVLLLDPGALFAFEGVTVGIPSVVLEELDQFKKEGTERGRNSRAVNRELDGLRERGSLHDGVALDHGGVVKILFLEREPVVLPFKLHTEDNDILLVALAAQEDGYDVTFISKDLNARVKADAIGLETEDYKREHITEEEFYRGWVSVPVPAVELKSDHPRMLADLQKEYDLALNQFVLLESQHNPHNYRVFRYIGGKKAFLPIVAPQLRWPLEARNAQQLMALNLLFDDSIPFVTLFGPAGTGKTFLALLAGLHEVLVDDAYKKVLVSRPVVPLGRDIGYLPGDIEEKLHSWMLPVFDNADLIMHAANVAGHLEQVADDEQYERDDRRRGRRGSRHRSGRKKDRNRVPTIQELAHRGKVSLEAITYMRGRSIPYQFILIDEAQNLNKHEVKTIVSRAGEGSKIVLCGDPYQIDSPYLDFSSNGLVVASERFKGQKLFGTVYLEKSERSELSQLVSDLM